MENNKQFSELKNETNDFMDEAMKLRSENEEQQKEIEELKRKPCCTTTFILLSRSRLFYV